VFGVSIAANLGLGGLSEVALPALAHGPLQTGAAGYGTLVAAFAGGGLAGTLVAAQTRRARRPALIASFGFLSEAAFTALIPYLGGTIAAAAALVGAGALNGLSNVLTITAMQRWAPQALLGRIMGFTLIGSFGIFPVSVLLGAHRPRRRTRHLLPARRPRPRARDLRRAHPKGVARVRHQPGAHRLATAIHHSYRHGARKLTETHMPAMTSIAPRTPPVPIPTAPSRPSGLETSASGDTTAAQNAWVPQTGKPARCRRIHWRLDGRAKQSLGRPRSASKSNRHDAYPW
jgi:hypothetical protein